MKAWIVLGTKPRPAPARVYVQNGTASLGQAVSASTVSLVTRTTSATRVRPTELIAGTRLTLDDMTAASVVDATDLARWEDDGGRKPQRQIWICIR